MEARISHKKVIQSSSEEVWEESLSCGSLAAGPSLLVVVDGGVAALSVELATGGEVPAEVIIIHTR